MLSLNALERASQAYRRGYSLGARGEPAIDVTNAEPGTFAARDFVEGHAAGVNDAKPMREAQARAEEARKTK